MYRKNAFTLIELIAVLVILAVVSLIVAPLILNTVRKVKESTNKRSVDGYGRAVEYAMADYQLVHLSYPDTFDKLDIQYTGSKVECETSKINPDYTIYLSKCKVNGKLVKDDKNKDGYYHYGTLKMTNIEYVDTYGKNLEDALKKYHDEHNEYPSDYTTLTLEELDKEVACDVSINYDGTVYLNNCKVDNEDVVDDNNEVYVYGDNKPYKPYVVGDKVKYNNINFYVIEDSDNQNESVTLLKEIPLTVNEVNKYGGVGTENNHVNRYTNGSIGTAYNYNGYGYIAFNSTDTCGYVNESKNTSLCNSNYNNSDIKYVIDNWTVDNIDDIYLKEVDNYKARLIKLSELYNLGYTDLSLINDDIPNWIYNSSYAYWTMTPHDSIAFYYIRSSGKVTNASQYNVSGGNAGAVRPVVNIYKSALTS